MHIQHSDIIDAPQEVVFALVKNHLPEIGRYLGNIDSISKIAETQLDSQRSKIINHWQAKVDLPLLIKKFLSKELISWKDTAIWDSATHTVAYELESFIANDLFVAKGKNSFKALNGTQTELTLQCDITIHAEKVPGLPKMIAGKAVPIIEGIIEKMLQPNIANLATGIRLYLANNQKIPR
jgi:hypothetical protein